MHFFLFDFLLHFSDNLPSDAKSNGSFLKSGHVTTFTSTSLKFELRPSFRATKENDYNFHFYWHFQSSLRFLKLTLPIANTSKLGVNNVLLCTSRESLSKGLIFSDILYFSKILWYSLISQSHKIKVAPLGNTWSKWHKTHCDSMQKSQM